MWSYLRDARDMHIVLLRSMNSPGMAHKVHTYCTLLSHIIAYILKPEYCILCCHYDVDVLMSWVILHAFNALQEVITPLI